MDRKELRERVNDRYAGELEELLEIIEVGIERISEDYIEEIERRIDELDIE